MDLFLTTKSLTERGSQGQFLQKSQIKLGLGFNGHGDGERSSGERFSAPLDASHLSRVAGSDGASPWR
jgi:hypothetical protein